MTKLNVVYARSHTIGGLIIRHAERWGRWSHCAIVVDGGRAVVEARAFHGVLLTPWSKFVRRYGSSRVSLQAIACPAPAVGELWAKQQVGKPYDYGAVLGALVRESWQDESRWMCSELVEAALVQAGARRFRDMPSRISPNISYMVI